MQYIIFVATLACALSAASAYNDPKIDQVESDIMSYVAENMGGIRMMRSSNSLVCYDKFIPIINNIAEEAKNKSKVCVDAASTLKQTALSVLTSGRAAVESQVKSIQNDLNACSAHTDNLEYVQCMFNIADRNKQVLDSIKSKTTELLQAYNSAVQGVDVDENTCLSRAVDGAKIESDAAFVDLKTCLAK